MRLPFLFSLSHNSDRIPDPIRPSIALSSQEIWESTDVGTDEIFGALPALEIVRAQWCRVVVDLNRSVHQKDSRGVIPRVDYQGRPVYRDRMVPHGVEADRRIMRYYHPYHEELQIALSAKGLRGMFDCHSLFGVGPVEAPDPGRVRPDIILGNKGDPSGNPIPSIGTVTCAPKIFRMMKAVFERNGFTVSLNHPYAGGFITAHYGKQLNAANGFAVQIEINQDLYLAPGEHRLLPDKVEHVKTNIFQSLDQIAGNL